MRDQSGLRSSEVSDQIYTSAEWLSDGSFLRRRNGHHIFYRSRGRGSTVLLLHGFPTWSYDYVDVARDLERDYKVISPDFIGYGGSYKPKGYSFSVRESADTIEELMKHLGETSVRLVIHDYGGIVGQELLDRHRIGRLSFAIESLVLLNFAIVYETYRPVLIQKLLGLPLIGGLISSGVTKSRVFNGINAARGANKISADEFDELWVGISKADGHKLAHRLIKYNQEREIHSKRWEDALYAYAGPTKLVWGLADPVSGAHVLDAARERLNHLPPRNIIELPDVGHFPQSEAPSDVAAAIRSF